MLQIHNLFSIYIPNKKISHITYMLDIYYIYHIGYAYTEYNVHKVYHDAEYGFPADSDDELFGRLILEINQAGLSWSTILNKQEDFKAQILFEKLVP